MKILVVNAGSSSLKYQLFEMETQEVLAKGICERIGIDGKITHAAAGNDKYSENIPMSNHEVAMNAVIRMLLDEKLGCIHSMEEIYAVGHRIVHGGPWFSEAVLVDKTVMEDLHKCIDLAPLHTKPHIMGIEGCMAVMKKTPQVLVFDTAFHQTMPEEAYRYAIPKDIFDKYRVRRYGFHGTSHRYVSSKAIDVLGLDKDHCKIITCHLGNGSSISAVKNGKVIDTSMGFTPLEGIAMGSRCGSMDPAIVPFLMDKLGMSPAETQDYMNKNCGILGVSGVSSDMRDICSAMAIGNPDAILATKILTYGIKKYIGSYTAAMNGLDVLVFTAGIGENTAVVREMATNDMDFFGIKLDIEKNLTFKDHPEDNIISTPDSKVTVIVIPTNEELVIAQDTEKVVNEGRQYVRPFF